MEKDMKKQIAEASRELLFEDQVKKLTVKAIVDKCKITRQAFYYHFEDIPDLLKWILDQASSQLEKEIFEQEDEEKALKRCFLIALESKEITESLSSQQRTVRNLLTRHLQGQEDLTGECR